MLFSLYISLFLLMCCVYLRLFVCSLRVTFASSSFWRPSYSVLTRHFVFFHPIFSSETCVQEGRSYILFTASLFSKRRINSYSCFYQNPSLLFIVLLFLS